MEQTLQQWSEWLSFPDPREKGFLHAPFGPGVYELRRADTKELILRGKGNNCAARMTSILPPPLGAGTRNNDKKRTYVLENLSQLEYRCSACESESEALTLEAKRKRQAPCLFNT